MGLVLEFGNVWSNLVYSTSSSSTCVWIGSGKTRCCGTVWLGLLTSVLHDGILLLLCWATVMVVETTHDSGKSSTQGERTSIERTLLPVGKTFGTSTAG